MPPWISAQATIYARSRETFLAASIAGVAGMPTPEGRPKAKVCRVCLRKSLKEFSRCLHRKNFVVSRDEVGALEDPIEYIYKCIFVKYVNEYLQLL